MKGYGVKYKFHTVAEEIHFDHVYSCFLDNDKVEINMTLRLINGHLYQHTVYFSDYFCVSKIDVLLQSFMHIRFYKF